MSIKNFLAYHNAVPIALGIAFLGAGGAFAAANPEAIYSAQQKVISIDNTYIANKDLASYTPKVQILGVTEDSDNYFVSYKFYTIDLKDYVWQEVAKDEEMKVSKPDLGPYRDLGLYVTEQLKQIVDRESMRLAETQDIERKYVTRKVVATAYGGLVGKFLDSTTEELPGYTPVVTPPAPPPVVVAQAEPANISANTDTQAQTAAASNSSAEQQQTQPQQSPQTSETVQPGTGDTIPPVIQVLGNNPARIAIGSTYGDLGAVVTDNVNTNLGIKVFLNGNAVESIIIDTAKTGEWTVGYESTDQAGNKGTAERKVIVFDPLAPTGETASSTPATPSKPEDDADKKTTPAPDSTPSTSSGQASSSQADATPPASSEQASSTQTAVEPVPSPANPTPATEVTASTTESSEQAPSSASTSTPPSSSEAPASPQQTEAQTATSTNTESASTTASN